MTDFTVPTEFIIIGSDADATGVSQIRPRKVIGGGAVVDGLDESDTLLRNARWCWTQANRVNLFASCAHGEASPQGVLYSTTSASYDTVWEVPVVLATGRLSFTAMTDMENTTIKYELFSSGDVSRGSVESTNAGGQNQTDATLTASSTDVAYLKIQVKATSGTSKVYGLRVFEDASTI